MWNNIPIANKPIDIPEYEYKQSKYDMVPKLPFRSIIVASSTGGKTVLIQNCLLNIYRSSLERICIFSPNIHADPAFYEVKKYQREVLKFGNTKEDLDFKGFNFKRRTKKRNYSVFVSVLMTIVMTQNLSGSLVCYMVYLHTEDIKLFHVFSHYKNTHLLLRL